MLFKPICAFNEAFAHKALLIAQSGAAKSTLKSLSYIFNTQKAMQQTVRCFHTFHFGIILLLFSIGRSGFFALTNPTDNDIHPHKSTSARQFLSSCFFGEHLAPKAKLKTNSIVFLNAKWLTVATFRQLVSEFSRTWKISHHRTNTENVLHGSFETWLSQFSPVRLFFPLRRRHPAALNLSQCARPTVCVCVCCGEKKNQHPIMGFLIIFMSTQIEITPEAKIYSREQIR
jgi:hypothetical protein